MPAVTMTRSDALAALTAPGQPYELQTATNHAGRPIKVFTNAPRSLRELFAGTASDLPFLVYELAAIRPKAPEVG